MSRLLRTAILVVFCSLKLSRVHASSSCYIAPPYTSHSIVSIYSVDEDHLSIVQGILRQHCQVRTFSGDLAHAKDENLFIVNKEQLEALKAKEDLIGEVKVEVENVSKYVESLPRQEEGYQQRILDESIPAVSRAAVDETFYQKYHVYADIKTRWEELVANNPKLVRSEVIGKTFEGRDIVALRIGNTSARNPKRVLFNGMQHAREWIAPMVPLYIAEKFVAKLAAGTGRVAAGLSQVEFTIIPLVNPDGYIYTRATDRFWRKNRRTGTACPAGGVDLNRNWAKDFGGGQSISSDPCSDVYPGTAAFSEPETDAIRQYVNRVGDFKVHIDFHSFSQLVLLPWAYTNADPPRAQLVSNLGNAYGKAILDRSNTTYVVGKGGEILYLASGTMQDWTTSQGMIGYTVELRPNTGGLQGFVLPEEQILITCKENWAGAKVVLQFVLNNL